MAEQILDLSGFTKDHDFYGEIRLMVTIKSFDLQAIRKRYIESRARKDGVTGSVQRREPGMGGVASLRISHGSILEERMLARMKEPRGICRSENYLGISSDTSLSLISEKGSKIIRDPWFSYIHTLDIDEERDELLVSSSGFDCFLTFSPSSGVKISDWYAWENGFNISQMKGKDGEELFVTRSENEKEEREGRGESVLFINDPLVDHLPTAQRTAFINSAHFAASDQILLTFFHMGQVMKLDRNSNKLEILFDGLQNPHGGRVFGSGFMATSTSDGRVVISGPEGMNQIGFSGLPGKPEGLENMEWIQNSIAHKDLIISIDSNRNSFVVFDPVRKLVDMIPFDPDWALQDLIIGDPNGLEISPLD